jgi:signal transduction histidine kinase
VSKPPSIANGILPAINADPDQFKEVLVNLMVNACEAMTGGGAIDIHERVIANVNGPAARLKSAYHR